MKLEVYLQQTMLCEAFPTLSAGKGAFLVSGLTSHLLGLWDKANGMLTTSPAGKRPCPTHGLISYSTGLQGKAKGSQSQSGEVVTLHLQANVLVRRMG